MSKFKYFSAYQGENFLYFSKLTKLLSAGQLLEPLEAFKQNRRIYFSGLVYIYLLNLNLSLKLVKPKYVKPFLVSLLIILLVQDARSAALKIHTECFLLFLVANKVWFSLNSVTTLQTQFPLFNPISQSLQWGFSLVYLHNIESPCSPWTYIAQTLNFLCVPQTPLRIWDRRQFAIGGYLIWRTEAGEYVFISSIANQVLEDEQRICTWNQYTAKGLAFWLVMKNVSSTLIGQSWSWVQETEWFLPESPNDKTWSCLT